MIEYKVLVTSICFFCRFYCLPENVTAGVPTSGYFDCPAGYYCPNGTGLDWMPCPKGTYSAKTNLYMVILVLLVNTFIKKSLTDDMLFYTQFRSNKRELESNSRSQLCIFFII